MDVLLVRVIYLTTRCVSEKPSAACMAFLCGDVETSAISEYQDIPCRIWASKGPSSQRVTYCTRISMPPYTSVLVLPPMAVLVLSPSDGSIRLAAGQHSAGKAPSSEPARRGSPTGCWQNREERGWGGRLATWGCVDVQGPRKGGPITMGAWSKLWRQYFPPYAGPALLDFLTSRL